MGVTSHSNANFHWRKKTLETWPLNIRHKVHLSAHYRFHLLPGIDSFKHNNSSRLIRNFLLIQRKKDLTPKPVRLSAKPFAKHTSHNSVIPDKDLSTHL